MKFFSKKKEDDFVLLEEPLNSNLVVPKKDGPSPSHKLTIDEVLNNTKPTTNKSENKSALASLKERMLTNAESLHPTTQQPQKEIDSIPLEAFGSAVTNDDNNPDIKLEDFNPKDEAKKEEPKPESKMSLLEKCKPFITDQDGNDAAIPKVPLYKLESVAEILENNRKKTVDRLAKQYNITVDDLGKGQSEEETEPEAEITPVIEQPELTNTQKKDVLDIESLFKNIQTNVPVSLSEIENVIQNKPSEPKESVIAQAEEKTTTVASTITFTPVSDNTQERPKIVVTSNTRSIDLTGEIAPVNQTENTTAQQIELEKNEFEEYIPDDEIKTEADIKKYIRSFSITKRRSFLSCSISVLLTAILGFMKLPFMSGAVLGSTKTTMIFCTCITFLTILLNIDMFKSLSKIFTRKSGADLCSAVASLAVLAYAVMGIIAGEIVLDILLLFGVIISLRALGKFRHDSYMLSNLRQISSGNSKNALKLIDDRAVTFAMCKNSIEGDALIAAPQKCKNISNFIKYSTFGTFMNGKMPIITMLSIVLAIVSGFAAANYFDSAVHGLYAAAAVLCFAAMPSIFFIKDFPLYAAAKKLNKKGCMIAGQMAASHIELANAIMVNSADIFPSGTVTLHQMKVLSENDLDKTILRAASLTECLNSPLAPIFKRIAGESNISSFPDSDTIKYEEQMGISGWVDDELLFIGNRTHMIAHGIQVPDIEIDHKILRNGYFPVYVANSDKVCALLVVQYSVDPEIARELRRLSKIGVTILVNNTDPNITDVMICDYLGLFEESVMIMTNAGYHMYKTTTTPKEYCSAPAAFRFGNISIARIMNCANKIKRCNTLLTALYVISSILGIMIFAYSSFTGSGTIIGSSTVLLYSLICTAVSYILYLIQKP